MSSMADEAPEHQNAAPGEQASPNTNEPNAVRRIGRIRTAALCGVVALPPVLNAQNIVEWANSPNGLGLSIGWAWIAFAGLDLIALVCVLETLIQTQRGRKAGAFAFLVWLFAGASAYAGYRHGTQPGVGRDVKWFFPFMAVAGPTLLHLILTRSRKDKQVNEGRRLTYASALAYGWKRWVPVIGAFGETFCSWRVGHLEGIVRPGVAIDRYRALRPDAGRSGMRVLRALRVEAERRRANAGTPSGPPRTAPTEQPNPTPAAEAVAPAERIKSRPSTKGVRPAVPNNDVETNVRRLREAFPDWRTNTPSVRKIAEVLGTAVSTGLAYRNRLLAEQGADAEERAS